MSNSTFGTAEPGTNTRPGGRRVYGPSTRRRLVALTYAILFTPLAVYLILEFVIPHKGHAGAGGGTLLIALAAMWAVNLIVAAYSSFALNWYLRPRLLRRVQTEYGVDLSAAHGAGVSPGNQLRRYISDTNWDVGFVTLEGDRLTFFGDAIAFELRADQVQRIEPIGKLSSFGHKSPKYVVTWRESPASEPQSFILEWSDVMSPKDRLKAPAESMEALRGWTTSRAPQSFPSRFGSPSFPDKSVGKPLGEQLSLSFFARTVGALVATFVLMVLIAVAGILVLGKDLFRHTTAVRIVTPMLSIVIFNVVFKMLRRVGRKDN